MKNSMRLFGNYEHCHFVELNATQVGLRKYDLEYDILGIKLDYPCFSRIEVLKPLDILEKTEEENTYVKNTYQIGLPAPLDLFCDYLEVKEHTEEIQYQIHEGGDVSREFVIEDNYSIRYDRVTWAATIVQGYKGFLRFTSKVVFEKAMPNVICLGGPVMEVSLIPEGCKSLVSYGP